MSIDRGEGMSAPPTHEVANTPRMRDLLRRMREERQTTYVACPDGVAGLPLSDLCVMMDCEWRGMGFDPFAYAILVGNYKTGEVLGLNFARIRGVPRTPRDGGSSNGLLGDDDTIAWWSNEERRELYNELTQHTGKSDEMQLEVSREFCRMMQLPRYHIDIVGDCDRDFWALHLLLGVNCQNEQPLSKGAYGITNYCAGRALLEKVRPDLHKKIGEAWARIKNPVKHHPLYDVWTEFRCYCAYRAVLDEAGVQSA